MKKTSFLVLVLGLLGLHRRVQLQFLWHGWGIDLDYCDIEWFALETNRNLSVIFEIASKYCISPMDRSLPGSSVHRLLQARILEGHHFANKCLCSQSSGFSSSHVWCESWSIKKAEHEELMLLNCCVGEDSWESLGLQGDPTSPFWRRSALGVL